MTLEKTKHLPFFYDNMESKTIVIFVHGILESPNQFENFAQILKDEGYSYSAILLEGHGKTGKDFAYSSMNKWIDSLENEIIKRKDRYERIILFGHSMGTLLSILAANKFKDKIHGLILLATPLKISIKFNMIVSSIKVALGIVKENDFLTTCAYNAFSVERCSLLTYIQWLPRYKDLFALIFSVKKELININIPTLVVHCDKDELVSSKSINILEKNLKTNYQLLNLEKSGHFYYDENDLNILLNYFKAYIKKHC